MTVRYVNGGTNRASDANLGTSLANPLRTLTAANNLMVSGDTTFVLSAQYHEAITPTVDGVKWVALEPDCIVDGSSFLHQEWTVFSGDTWSCPMGGGSTLQNLYVNDRLHSFPALAVGSIAPAFEPITGITENAFIHDFANKVLYLNLGGPDPNQQLIKYGARTSCFRLLSRANCTVEGFKLQRSNDRGVLITGGSGHVIRRNRCWQNPAGGIRVEGPRPSLFKPTIGAGTSSLPAGTYTYQTTAVIGGVETVPATYQQITITAGQVVSLSWQGLPGATEYRLYGRSAVGPPTQPTGTLLATIISGAAFPVYNDDGSATPDGSTHPPFTTTVKAYNVLVEDNETWNNGSHGISIFDASAHIVRDNRSHHNAAHGVALQYDASDNTVERNQCWLNQKALVRTSNGIICDNFGVGTPGCPRNIVQRNQVFRNQDSGVSVYNGSEDCIVRYNISYLNGDHGIDNFNAKRCHMSNNTAYKCVTAGLNSEGGGTGGGEPSLGIRMHNNISMDNGIGSPRTSGNYRIDALTTPDSEFDYNLSYLTVPAAEQTAPGSNYEFQYGGGSYDSYGELRAAHPEVMAHGISADPVFSDLPNFDFTLADQSPALGAGTIGAPGYSPYDFHGRQPAGAPNLGAYQAAAT